MAAIVRASHAISFQLLNRDRHPILGIFDGQQAQTLTLEITNSSRRDLKPKELSETKASADHHHFELKFRPGTLNLSGKPAISVDEGDAGWRISDPIPTDEGISFYLLITKPAAIAKDATIAVTLNNLSGDGKRGAHGTRVELRWKEGSLEYLASASGQSPEPLVAGHRIQHLSIVNESGQKHIPLHVGIVGNNRVLNDGSSDTTLRMRITNLLKPKEGSIQLNPKDKTGVPPETVFTISFDAGTEADAWALAQLSQVQAIKIKAVAKKRDGSEIAFADPGTPQGQSRSWPLIPSKAVSLESDEFVEITISGIKTSLPSGQTNVHVHYKNIPGYWDGDFVSVIEKAPLVYKEETVGGVKEQRVGIGTSNPTTKLHVTGKVRVDNDLSVGGSATFDNLRVNKKVSVGGEGVFEVDKPGGVGGRLKIDTDGRVGIGTNDPKSTLHVNGKLRVEKEVSVAADAAFEVDATNVAGGRLKIATDGKVGLGTSPEKHLHIAGAGDQEIMIQCTDDNGGVKWSLQSSAAGSGGRFELINRTAGQSRLVVSKDGNVGMGTVSPGSNINTANYFKADAEGRILELHSPTREADLILSTNQDADGASLGGVYFTRTRGASDAHREVAGIRCVQAGGGTFGGGVLQFFTKPNGDGARNPRMVILDNGNVGIGTAKPQKASLEVGTTVAAEVTYGYRYMNLHRTENDHRKQTRDYSIWASGRIAADEFNAVSDARIKSIRGLSDGAADLSTLLSIQITDYSFRDVVGKGAAAYKKVIGQQVEKVFPQAISKQADVVPDIYRPAPIRNGWVALPTDLKIGERVKLITETGNEGTHEVLEVTPDKFRVDLDPEGEKVFVFGREVNDLITVDYDAISMLNVSATQQLKKEMDHEVKALRAENAELRAANDALAKRLQLLESKLETVARVMSAANGSNGNGRH